VNPKQGKHSTAGPGSTGSTEGTVLGDRYTLTERIAAGGMGEVWAAADTVLGRTVAIKLMHPALGEDPDFVERFRSEARHTAALHHPNITTVFDYGEDGGTSYVVMELVTGQPLSRLISERAPLTAQATASILSQTAGALEAAHQGGVVHRDVKPANILVTPDGTVKLTDFGISRAVDATPLTQTGQIVGTAQYLSPEQALGQSATASSDIYALGVVGHEMLTGKRPFDAGNTVATALAHVSQPAPPLPETVPAGIRDVIGACLAKNPADRPASAAAVAQALGMPAAGLVAPATWPAAPVPTQAVATQAVPTQAVPTQAMATQTMATQTMATQTMATQPPGIPDERSGRRPAWLLGSAAALVLAVVTVFALSDGGRGSDTTTPVAPATSSPNPTPSTSATARVAPPAVIPPVPRRDNTGPGNKRDDKKGK
jgi:serine/threonine protein kinase